MKYYSIRVVEADNLEEAVAKVMSEDFDETDPICDKVLTLEEFCNKMNPELSAIGRGGIPTWESNAEHYLCDSDESVYDQVLNIAEHAEEHGEDMIDSVDGVFVWEKVENKFTCDEFLELIGYAG